MALTQLTKVDGGGISTTSDYRVGIITASKFVGPFDGTGGNFSGVVTATNGVFSGNISAVDGNFSGNVTIGGTLTYEDVTNIDSVGIVTAAKDIHVGAGVSAVGVGTFGSLDIGGDIDVDGHTNLDNVSVAGVVTTTGNVNVGVDLDVTDDITLGGELNMQGSSDNNKYFDARIGSSNKLIFRSSSGGAGNLVTMLQLGVTGSSLVGNFALGASSDSSSAAGPEFTLNRNSSSPANADYLGQIKFAGRSSAGVQRNYAKITGKILDVTNGSEDGILEFSHIRNGSQAITGRWRSDSLQLLNDTNLSVAGDTTLTSDLDVDGHTNLDNVSIAGVSTFSEGVIIPDSKALSLGNRLVGSTAGDLRLYHDTNNSYIDEIGAGNLYIRNNTNNSIFCQTSGTVQLYYNGNDKLATTNTGVTVTGTLVAGALDISGDIDVDGHTNLDNISVAGVSTFTGNADFSAGIDVVGTIQDTGTTAKLNLTNSGTNATEQIATLYTSNSGTHNRIVIKTYTNGGGDPYIKFDAGGQDMIVGTRYAGTTNNLLVLGPGNDPDTTSGIFVKGNGNIGIAEDNPTRKLDVSGDVLGNAFMLRGNTTASPSIQAQMFRPENNTLAFATDGNNERLRIDSVGRVIIANGGSGGTADVNADNFVVKNYTSSGSCGISILNADNLNSTLYFGNASDAKHAEVVWSDASNLFLIGTSNAGASIKFRTADQSDALTIDSSGKSTFAAEIATAQDYPNQRPTLDFNFAKTKALDPRLSYIRSGPASYYDDRGLLVLVGDDTPRFDHDPMTRESKGILLEESRRNMQPHSIQYGSKQSNGWVNVVSQVYVDYHPEVVTPTGDTIGAITFKDKGGTTQHYLSTDVVTVSSGTTYTFSFFFKSISGSDANNVKITTSGGNLPYEIRSFYFTGSDTGLATGDDTTLTQLPNGWWRATYVVTASGNGNAALIFDLHALNSGAPKNNVIAIYGLQCEIGDFPTSYIPTDGNYAIRGGDTLTMTGSDLSEVFNEIEGTMFYEASLESLTRDNQPVVAFRDISSTTSDYHAMGWRIGGGTSVIRTWFRSNSGNEFLSSHGSTGLTSKMFYKHIYGYKLSDCADAYSTPTSSGLVTQAPATGDGNPMITQGLVDELRFGGYYSLGDTYKLDAGHIKRFSYWTQKLTNTQLTTYIS